MTGTRGRAQPCLCGGPAAKSVRRVCMTTAVCVATHRVPFPQLLCRAQGRRHTRGTGDAALLVLWAVYPRQATYGAARAPIVPRAPMHTPCGAYLLEHILACPSPHVHTHTTPPPFHPPPCDLNTPFATWTATPPLVVVSLRSPHVRLPLPQTIFRPSCCLPAPLTVLPSTSVSTSVTSRRRVPALGLEPVWRVWGGVGYIHD